MEIRQNNIVYIQEQISSYMTENISALLQKLIS